MTCKNCQEPLEEAYHFCPNCGARIVYNRITFKKLLKQFTGWLFDLDNAFVRTFTGMLSQPERVIRGYISGVRKKYMSPLSFMTIAITMAGFMVFMIQRLYQGEIDLTMGAQEINPEFSQTWTDISFEFNAFFFILNLPILALPAYLFINRVNYNFAEYLVVFVYTMCQWVILTFPINLIAMFIDIKTYLFVNQSFSLLLLVYCLYVLQRLNGFGFWGMAGRSLLYLILAVILFFILIGGIMGLLFLTGTLDLESLRPPET